MGLIAGGSAEKLGNRYEGRWVVKQLLQLLAERIRSVQLEAIGDDEEGVDLWVSRRDGVREAQQCKAFNKSKSNWSIADLGQRKVLSKARSQLNSDAAIEFTFVSTVLAVELEDLCRIAREVGSTSGPFFEQCAANGSRQTAFVAVCKAFGADPTNNDARVSVFELLRRIHVHQFQDNKPTRDDLEFDASLLLCGGPPAAAIAALSDIAESNLHKTLPARLFSVGRCTTRWIRSLSD